MPEAARSVLDRLLDPVRDVLTPEIARAIAELRAGSTTWPGVTTRASSPPTSWPSPRRSWAAST
jgi:hypothetical protein